MSRLIDADALMESLGITNMECDKCAWYDWEWSNCKRGGDFEDACCAIENAPTIEPEPQWIPCSERLPEEKSDWKNVTVLDESGDSAFTYVSVGYYLNDGMWIVDNEPMEEGNLIRVVAWMPLPEPYAERREE